MVEFTFTMSLKSDYAKRDQLDRPRPQSFELRIHADSLGEATAALGEMLQDLYVSQVVQSSVTNYAPPEQPQ